MFNDTLELRALTNSKDFNLFDFPYNLYDNDLKEQWEKLFIQNFEFHEIGFETIGRFKRRLKNKLDMIYPYYKEYYKTVLQVETEEFMITKDLLETYERTIEGENTSLANSEQTSIGDNLSNSTNIFSNTPKGSIDNLDNYMSNASKDNSSSKMVGESSSEENVIQKNNAIEKTTFHSKGDLGVSSSGILIDGWRNVITNINQMMFDELEELFISVL